MKRWTTEEQGVYLEAQIPQHLEHSLKNKIHLFWPILYAGWFLKWPETDVEPSIDPDTGKLEPTIRAVSWMLHFEEILDCTYMLYDYSGYNNGITTIPARAPRSARAFKCSARRLARNPQRTSAPSRRDSPWVNRSGLNRIISLTKNFTSTRNCGPPSWRNGKRIGTRSPVRNRNNTNTFRLSETNVVRRCWRRRRRRSKRRWSAYGGWERASSRC